MTSTDAFRVGANLLWLRPGEVGGTETYARRVLRALASSGAQLGDSGEAKGPVELHLFGSGVGIDAVRPTGGSVEDHVAAPDVIAPPRRVFVERTWLPGAIRSAQLDVIHHLGGTVPVSSKEAAIVTIHDLQPLEFSDNFSKTKVHYLSRAIPQAIERARIVTTPSNWVRERVIDRFDLSPDTVLTVSVFAEPVDLAEAAQPSASVQRLLSMGPMLLYPAMTLGHKNHFLLFDAFSKALERDPELQLICVGPAGRDDEAIRARASELSPQIKMLGHVSKADLDALYRSADALVFPSTYEGFGLPVLEAQHYGLPVICSNTTALPEVAGVGAVMVDPSNVSDWVDAIVDRPTTSALEQLVSAGLKNAQRYNLESTAEQQWHAYRLATA